MKTLNNLYKMWLKFEHKIGVYKMQNYVHDVQI